VNKAIKLFKPQPPVTFELIILGNKGFNREINKKRVYRILGIRASRVKVIKIIIRQRNLSGAKNSIRFFLKG